MPPDDSTQQPIPEGGGGETPAQNQPDEKGSPRQNQNVPPADGNNGGQPKPWMRAVVIFAALQALGTIVDVISSDLTGYWRFSFHWMGLCCHVAGVFAVWHEATSEIETPKKLRQVWMFCFGPACVVCFLIAWAVWWPAPDTEPPKPYFTFTLTTAENPNHRIKLTNDFLLNKNQTKVFGCLIVPREMGQSNVNLRLTIGNDSSVPAKLGVVGIMLPEEWDCVPDSGWTPGDGDFGMSKTSLMGDVKPIEMQILVCRLPTILPRMGQMLPNLRIKLPEPDMRGSAFLLVAQAEDSDRIRVVTRLQVPFAPRSGLREDGWWLPSLGDSRSGI